MDLAHPLENSRTSQTCEKANNLVPNEANRSRESCRSKSRDDDGLKRRLAPSAENCAGLIRPNQVSQRVDFTPAGRTMSPLGLLPDGHPSSGMLAKAGCRYCNSSEYSSELFMKIFIVRHDRLGQDHKSTTKNWLKEFINSSLIDVHVAGKATAQVEHADLIRPSLELF